MSEFTLTKIRNQKHLANISLAISERLQYFRELERATRMLNLPGENIVLEDDFLNMLDRLDRSLAWLNANVRCPIALRESVADGI